jgi:hypothetical protein
LFERKQAEHAANGDGNGGQGNHGSVAERQAGKSEHWGTFRDAMG